MNGQGVSLTSAIRPACPVATPLPLRSQHASYRIAGVRHTLSLNALFSDPYPFLHTPNYSSPFLFLPDVSPDTTLDLLANLSSQGKRLAKKIPFLVPR